MTNREEAAQKRILELEDEVHRLKAQIEGMLKVQIEAMRRPRATKTPPPPPDFVAVARQARELGGYSYKTGDGPWMVGLYRKRPPNAGVR